MEIEVKNTLYSKITREEVTLQRLRHEEGRKITSKIIEEDGPTLKMRPDGSKEAILQIVMAPPRSIIDECSICLEILNKKYSHCALLECTHWFHFTCIKSCLTTIDDTCPICKEKVSIICITNPAS